MPARLFKIIIFLMGTIILPNSLFGQIKASGVSAVDQVKASVQSSPMCAQDFNPFDAIQLDSIQLNENIYGRILKGKAEKDFETLSNDSNRKIIFLMDHKALQKVICLPVHEMLKQVGYTQDYIDQLEKEGYKFRLVLFSKDAQSGLPATWDNLMHLLKMTYPASVMDRIAPYFSDLKSTPFQEIQNQAASLFSAVNKDKKHPEYMSVDKFLADNEPTLWKARAFLYYNVRLTELYSGDGFSYDESGKRLEPEFIAPNVPLKDLKDVQVIPLK